nr:MAG TPA: hypothetical protein [Caudoviricetes sp.]
MREVIRKSLVIPLREPLAEVSSITLILLSSSS